MKYEGINFIATYTDAHNISPNLGWLDLRVMHCGPRGEAITHRHTRHQIFWIEPHDNIRPGAGSPSMAQVLCRLNDKHDHLYPHFGHL
jgi:hypothetical protein